MRDYWPLTGRGEELGLIAEVLSDGRHRGVALAGRAGIGKSRLAREAVAEASRSGWSVRHVAATATGRSVPLGAFAHWTDEFDGAPLTLARRVIGALTAGRAGSACSCSSTMPTCWTSFRRWYSTSW